MSLFGLVWLRSRKKENPINSINIDFLKENLINTD